MMRPSIQANFVHHAFRGLVASLMQKLGKSSMKVRWLLFLGWAIWRMGVPSVKWSPNTRRVEGPGKKGKIVVILGKTACTHSFSVFTRSHPLVAGSKTTVSGRLPVPLLHEHPWPAYPVVLISENDLCGLLDSTFAGWQWGMPWLH